MMRLSLLILALLRTHAIYKPSLCPLLPQVSSSLVVRISNQFVEMFSLSHTGNMVNITFFSCKL